MNKLLLTLPAVICYLFFISSAPQDANDPVAGTWKGTSICQVKGSACNDEIAVYYATKVAGHNAYNFKMDKVVNGKEEEMGTLMFEMNYASRTLTAVNKSARGKGVWSFKVTGNTIHGTLTIDKKTIYRVIDFKKS